MKPRPNSRLMTTGEVAAAFGVTHRTIRTWADEGRLAHIKTLGGHRRFDRSQINMLRANDWPANAAEHFEHTDRKERDGATG